jgi:RND family efflux transporter MFP subunit
MRCKVSLIILVCLLVSSCKHNNEKKSEFVKTVKVFNLSEKLISSEIEITGVIKEKRSVDLAFRIAGPIHKLPVEIGSFVKKNELIAEIDPRDYKLKYDATKAEYDQVISEADRVEELFKRKSIPQNDYDKAVSGKQRISVKMEAATNSLNDTKLLAPFDGYIQEKYFENFETVDAGMPIVSLIDLKTLIVETEVSASLYLKKSQFKSYRCEPVDIANANFDIKLIEASKKSNNNQLYTLRFELRNRSGEKLFPGMNVNVFISKLAQNTKFVKIPVSCVFEKDGKSFVWVVQAGVIKSKQVSLGRIGLDSTIEVEGLNLKDQVVSAGVHQLKENQKVKVLKKASKTNVGGML